MYDILFLRPESQRITHLSAKATQHIRIATSQSEGSNEGSRAYYIGLFHTAKFMIAGGVMCSRTMPANGCGNANEKALTLLPARKQSLPLIPSKSYRSAFLRDLRGG